MDQWWLGMDESEDKCEEKSKQRYVIPVEKRWLSKNLGIPFLLQFLCTSSSLSWGLCLRFSIVIGSPWKAALTLRHFWDRSRLSMPKSDRSLFWYRVDGVLTPLFDVLPARSDRSNKDTFHGCCMVSKYTQSHRVLFTRCANATGSCLEQVKATSSTKVRNEMIDISLTFRTIA